MNKVKKMHNLRKVTGNWTKNLQKLGAQRKTPHPEIRRNPRTSRMTKKKNSEPTCNAIQLTRFYKRRDPNKRYFKTE